MPSLVEHTSVAFSSGCGLENIGDSMDEFALILHPTLFVPEEPEGTPEDHGLCIDPVLQSQRTFTSGSLQITVTQTWRTATEKEW